MTSLRLSFAVLVWFCAASLGCSSDALCPSGWDAVSMYQCVATPEREAALTRGLGTSGAFGFTGSVDYPINYYCDAGASYTARRDPIEIRTSCGGLLVVSVVPSETGEWATGLPPGSYCIGVTPLQIDEGRFNMLPELWSD